MKKQIGCVDVLGEFWSYWHYFDAFGCPAVSTAEVSASIPVCETDFSTLVLVEVLPTLRPSCYCGNCKRNNEFETKLDQLPKLL